MGLKIKHFNHVAVNLPVGEVKNARKFYGGILGLKEVTPPALEREEEFDFIWYELPHCWIHLRFVLPSVEEQKKKFIQLKDNDKAHFSLEVEDLHELRKELEAKKVYIFEAPVLEDRDRFMITDPFGNAMELLEMHVNQKVKANSKQQNKS